MTPLLYIEGILAAGRQETGTKAFHMAMLKENGLTVRGPCQTACLRVPMPWWIVEGWGPQRSFRAWASRSTPTTETCLR